MVADDGPGFPDTDPTERGRSSGGSTGLGLDIAQRIGEASGGTLTIGPSTSGGGAVTVGLGPPIAPPGRNRRYRRAGDRSQRGDRPERGDRPQHGLPQPDGLPQRSGLAWPGLARRGELPQGGEPGGGPGEWGGDGPGEWADDRTPWSLHGSSQVHDDARGR